MQRQRVHVEHAKLVIPPAPSSPGRPTRLDGGDPSSRRFLLSRNSFFLSPQLACETRMLDGSWKTILGTRLCICIGTTIAWKLTTGQHLNVFLSPNHDCWKTSRFDTRRPSTSSIRLVNFTLDPQSSTLRYPTNKRLLYCSGSIIYGYQDVTVYKQFLKSLCWIGLDSTFQSIRDSLLWSHSLADPGDHFRSWSLRTCGNFKP